MKLKKMLFVFNPNSGKAEIQPRIYELLDIFVKGGYLPTVYPTQKALEATEIIAENAGNYDIIAASGGDGTLNEAVSGLMQGGKPQLFGYIPAGTVNDFATSLKIPKDMKKAAQTIVSGTPVSCDVGSFGGKYFTYIAAFGAFTNVAYQTPQQYKNVLGRPAYLLEGLRQLPSIHPYHMAVQYDGGEIEGDFVFGMIGNSTSVGGFQKLAGQEVALNDGLFELLLIRQPESITQMLFVINALLKREEDSQELIFRTKSTRFQIQSPDLAPWTLDGEFGGAPSQVEISVLPQALNILTPREALGEIPVSVSII